MNQARPEEDGACTDDKSIADACRVRDQDERGKDDEVLHGVGMGFHHAGGPGRLWLRIGWIANRIGDAPTSKPVQDVRNPQDARKDRYPCQVRSEEHTSELQSLMRISYAVFCL